VAITFARYCRELVPQAPAEPVLATVALIGLSAVNCLGVRAGSDVQSLLMILKTAAIVALVAVGFLAGGPAPAGVAPLVGRAPSLALVTALGAALVPVLFAYGGWQTAGFVMGELKEPRRDMPRALVIGVAGVIVCTCDQPGLLAAATAPHSPLPCKAAGRGPDRGRHRDLDLGS
jgi:APA family basic amino acid/polyamine antiporter